MPSLYADHIKPAANFVASHGPSFGVERWEEQDGYSPSTIAAEIAGLVAAADLADANHDPVSAAVWRGVADDYQRSIKGWTVTTNGPLAPRYFIRLSKTGDPNAAISYSVGNGGPTLDQRSVIDAGFLELARLGELPANDPDILASLPVVDATIRSNTASGPGWHRYNGDGYGDRASDGHPWAPSGVGTGHLWPALSSERAEQSLQTGERDRRGVRCSTAWTSSPAVSSLIPEQDWESAEPRALAVRDAARRLPRSASSTASPQARPARSTGRRRPSYGCSPTSARAASATARRARTSRYVAHTQRTTPLTVTSPADESAVSASPVTVTGTTAPGNAVYVTATNTDANSATTSASTTADAAGAFSVAVAVTGGTIVLNVVAVSTSGGTAHVKRSVVFDFVPGTMLLDVTDPSGDDNGPGNYAYPTSDNFHPGAFDIQEFQVFDDGTNVIFRVKVRDLTPTFGSPLGAQLSTSTCTIQAPPRPQPRRLPPTRHATSRSRRRCVEPADPGAGVRSALRGCRRRDARHGRDQRERRSPASSLSGSRRRASARRAPGWAFTVVLAGQDGFSGDQARGFQPTPQDFQFGVCATPSADPHCTFSPGAVPKRWT